jgi:hypothetical protein
MSPACYRYFMNRVEPPVRVARLDDGVTQTARLVFDAVMSAPDIPDERSVRVWDGSPKNS